MYSFRSRKPLDALDPTFILQSFGLNLIQCSLAVQASDHHRLMKTNSRHYLYLPDPPSAEDHGVGSNNSDENRADAVVVIIGGGKSTQDITLSSHSELRSMFLFYCPSSDWVHRHFLHKS